MLVLFSAIACLQACSVLNNKDQEISSQQQALLQGLSHRLPFVIAYNITHASHSLGSNDSDWGSCVLLVHDADGKLAASWPAGGDGADTVLSNAAGAPVQTDLVPIPQTHTFC